MQAKIEKSTIIKTSEAMKSIFYNLVLNGLKHTAKIIQINIIAII